MESVKLSTDHVLPLLQLVFNESSTNIDVQNLTITHLINNMSVNDIITPEEIKEGLKFNSLSATKLTVLGNINVTGKVMKMQYCFYLESINASFLFMRDKF